MPGLSTCNFCGGARHYIRKCEVVNKYIHSGKCKCSPDRKVILASGVMVLCGIMGAWLRNRIDEWHRLNPGQMAMQMLFEVMASATVPPNDTAGQSTCSCPAKHVDQPSRMIPLGIYALARQMRPHPEAIITSQPPHQSGLVGQGGDNGSTNNGREKLPHLEKDASAAKPGNVCREEQEPIHLYAKAADASHGLVPEPARPAKPAQKEAARRSDPAYTTQAKVFNLQIAKEVYERAMEAPITITQRELLSLAPEVCAQIVDITIKKHIPCEPVAQAMIEEVMDKDKPTLKCSTTDKH